MTVATMVISCIAMCLIAFGVEVLSRTDGDGALRKPGIVRCAVRCFSGANWVRMILAVALVGTSAFIAVCTARYNAATMTPRMYDIADYIALGLVALVIVMYTVWGATWADRVRDAIGLTMAILMPYIVARRLVVNLVARNAERTWIAPLVQWSVVGGVLIVAGAVVYHLWIELAEE